MEPVITTKGKLHAKLQTTTLLCHSCSAPDTNKVMAKRGNQTFIEIISIPLFARLKCLKAASTFLATTWQSNCEMLKKRVKSVILLQPYLRTGPLKVNSTVQANITLTLKVLKIFFCVERPKEALQKEKVTKQRQKVMEHQQVLQIKTRVIDFESFLSSLMNYLQ